MGAEGDLPRAAGEHLRVLVVDDNEDIRETTCALLRLEGYDARCAADGAQALDVAAQSHFDAALIDISMPVLGGLEVAGHLRRYHPDIALAAVTALGSPSDVSRSLAAGFRCHITKPTSLADILEFLCGVEQT